jgi:hypothetical protein
MDNATLHSSPDVVLLVGRDQVDMLGRGLVEACYNKPEGRSVLGEEELEELDRALSGQRLPSASWDGRAVDTERGPVVRLTGGCGADGLGRPGAARQPGRREFEGRSGVPVFRLSVLADVALGMSREQLALFAGAIGQTVEVFADYEFEVVHCWPRTRMRELEARLVEVMACLDELDGVAGEGTGR